jgi:hypothetical protein
LQPGEKRTLRKIIWVPPLTVTALDVELTAGQYESVRIRDSDVELLRVTETLLLQGKSVQEASHWVDRQGRIVKSMIPAAQHEVLKCAKTEALKPLGEQRFDAGWAMSVPVTGAPRGLPAARRAVYRVAMKEVDPHKVFAQGVSQQIRSEGTSATILVRAVRPDTPGLSDDSRPTGADLTPNDVIDANHEKVVQAARQAAPEEKDAWKLATALESYVYRSMKRGHFGKVMATAGEVAESLEGDCTEYAVFLAALARVRGIPARVVYGMVYDDGRQAFPFHMWTEVFVADRWIALDATRGRGGISAAYLKLTDSNLAGQDALPSLIRVAEVLGRFEKLEVLEVE